MTGSIDSAVQFLDVQNELFTDCLSTILGINLRGENKSILVSLQIVFTLLKLTEDPKD